MALTHTSGHYRPRVPGAEWTALSGQRTLSTSARRVAVIYKACGSRCLWSVRECPRPPPPPSPPGGSSVSRGRSWTPCKVRGLHACRGHHLNLSDLPLQAAYNSEPWSVVWGRVHLLSSNFAVGMGVLGSHTQESSRTRVSEIILESRTSRISESSFSEAPECSLLLSSLSPGRALGTSVRGENCHQRDPNRVSSPRSRN